MNSKILSIMEFDRIKQAISSHLVSAAGRTELSHLTPIYDVKLLQTWIDETKDGADIYRLKGGMPIPQLSDVTPHMKRLEIDATLSGTELAQISRVLRTARDIERFFEDLDHEGVELTQLPTLLERLTVLPDINQRLFVSIEGDGRITDDASPAIKSIRQQISTTEADIRSRMETYTRGKDAKYLSDPIVTIRNDRFVIPVRSDSRSHFGGIVHDQSATGQTLFIEPDAVVTLNNRLKQHQSEERIEEHRILQELSALLAPYREEILENARLLGHLDFVNAKAIYAHELKATEPHLSIENHVNLRAARHPLIDQHKVVANDLAIGEDYGAIVVTGPNTGGKTIALKTFGLVQLMGQSGLFIPANENSVIGVYEDIFADIGDEQSIEQSLSTFSAHMDNIVSILKAANNRSLIILDELGAGTDPQEGAAIAIAILDYIGTIGSHVIASTHYPELKVYGYDHEGTINASMEFDQETLRPTYRFLIGIPGQSNAIQIASRLGLDPSIIEEARSLTDKDSQSLNDMIGDLTAKRKQADDEARELATQLSDATELHEELRQAYNDYQAQKEQLVEKAKQDANRQVSEVQKQADVIIHDLRQRQLDAGNALVKENELIDAKGALNSLKQDTSLKQNRVLKREKAKHDFKKGDEVLVKSYGQRGTLMAKLDGNQWEVQLGILKMKLPENDLEKASGPDPKQKAPRATVKRTTSSGMSPTLDLRGHRYEAAMEEVDRFIDSALLAGYPSVTIIHGKGTGALRQGVTEYLQSNRRVKSFGFSPANAGGDGSTVVKL